MEVSEFWVSNNLIDELLKFAAIQDYDFLVG
jgi:hypothetical protein